MSIFLSMLFSRNPNILRPDKRLELALLERNCGLLRDGAQHLLRHQGGPVIDQRLLAAIDCLVAWMSKLASGGDDYGTIRSDPSCLFNKNVPYIFREQLARVIRERVLDGRNDALTCRIIERAWVILNPVGVWLGYSVLSMIAGVSTALKPDQ